MNKSVLVIEDSSFSRELVARALRQAGYEVYCAGNGREGLEQMSRAGVGLVVLDNEMPEMDGLTFLRTLRNGEETWRHLPVIMLTSHSERPTVLTALELKVAGYLLKSGISVEALIEKVRWLMAGAPAEEKHIAAPAPAEPVKESVVEMAKPVAVAASRVTKAEILRAADEMQHLRTLGGAVTQALAYANSPRGSVQDLTVIIQQDPVLSTRVFRMANSAAYAGKRANNVEEALRKIGTDGVRTLAMSAGVIDSFADSAGSVEMLRCWQHGLGVAALMESMLENEPRVKLGTAHLVGLCHDLAEIFLRQAFPEGYSRASKMAAERGEATLRMVGECFAMSYGEITAEVVRRSQLPEDVARPIVQYANQPTARLSAGNPLGRALKIADATAHGLLLASSPDVRLGEPTAEECLGLSIETGGGSQLRSDVVSISCSLGRLSASEEAKAIEPLLPSSRARVLLVNDRANGCINPMEDAMNMLCNVTVADSPAAVRCRHDEIDGLIVAAPDVKRAEAMFREIEQKMGGGPKHVLLLTGRKGEKAAGRSRVATCPVSLRGLWTFVTGCGMGA